MADKAQRFWTYIHRARAFAPDDDDAVLERLRGILGGLSAAELCAFHQCLLERLAEADRWEVRIAAGLLIPSASAHDFLGFRAWLVAQGRAVYEGVLTDVEALADRPMRQPPYLPRLRWLADEVHRERFGGPLIERRVRAPWRRRPPSDPESAFARRYPRLRRNYAFAARVRQRLRWTLALVCLALSAAAIVAPWWWTAVAVPLAFWLLVTRFHQTWNAHLVADFLSRARARGKSERLEGTVRYQVVLVQADDLPVGFDEGYKDDLHVALRFLEREAARYGRALRFVPMRAQPHRIRISVRMCGPDGELSQRFLREVREVVSALPLRDHAGPAFALVVTPPAAFEVRAFPAAPPSPQTAEFCLGPSDDGSLSWAREILQLFGAHDPREVGRIVQRAMARLSSTEYEVDPATAYSVGWLDGMPRSA